MTVPRALHPVRLLRKLPWVGLLIVVWFLVFRLITYHKVDQQVGAYIRMATNDVPQNPAYYSKAHKQNSTTSQVMLAEDMTDLKCDWNEEHYKCLLNPSLYRKGGEYDRTLAKYADSNKTVFLASVDSGYIDMALNMFETSFKKLSIRNFLFVCSDQEARARLNNDSIDCFLFDQNLKGNAKASLYMSKDFVIKTHIKTKIILGALVLGYTVILTDVDIVFLKNPLDHFSCGTCDMEIQSDHVEMNSGFYLVRPTNASIKLHQYALKHASLTKSNQKALNEAVRYMRKRNSIKVTTLSKELFPCGIYYFETDKRLWSDDNPCSSCVIVHNNWITGKSAKVYRFKEHLMWLVDDQEYYSSETRKYLVYENPVLGEGGRNREMLALRTALSLGYLLNRTVILPAFTCSQCQEAICKGYYGTCPLNVHARISALDTHFKHMYREHMFLSHPKVPVSVKSSMSPTVLILSSDTSRLLEGTDKSGLITFQPASPEKGASVTEILQWFAGPYLTDFSILRFHSLYDAFEGFSDQNMYKGIITKLKKGIVKASYRQYI